MTIQKVDAIYEHGTFRLVQPSTMVFHEGQRVRILIETEPMADDILALATSVYAGLSEQDISEIETLAQRREPFFGDRS
jgi:predicted DNA-binding antitoxin AbrB/MazE fold protein